MRYRCRMLDVLLAELLAELPAVMVTGPRAGGKTTTAARHAASVVRLDRALEAEAFRADPDVALREYEEPILLDEWQEEPGVLGAVKRAVTRILGPAGSCSQARSVRNSTRRRGPALDGWCAWRCTG